MQVVNIEREFMLVIDTITSLCLEMVSSRVWYIAARNEISLDSQPLALGKSRTLICSTRVSGYSESQAQTQLLILQQLTTLARSGKYIGTLGTPSKVVHAGHSFGSFLSNSLIATTPALSDAAILTGITYGAASPTFFEAWGLRIATGLAPGK
jgi:hypothetical protein